MLPNANLPKAQQGVPEAEIVYEVNGKKTKFKWTSSSKDHPDLASLSVFDSHCARAYCDAEQDVAYMPYGLDIVENLANVVLPELSTRLKKAIADVAVDTTQFVHLAGTTKVGAVVASLSAKTDPKLIETLSTLSATESERLASLRETLCEKNPKQKAAELKRFAGRVTTLHDIVASAARVVDAVAIESLQSLVHETATAIAAEKLAAQIFHSDEDLLPGTGCEEWQSLFEAARTFAALAYKDQDAEFPDLKNNARCPLCQQELLQGADRLKRFDTFIKDNAATVAKSKRDELARSLKSLGEAKLSLTIEPSLAEEISHHKPDLCATIGNFEKAIEEKRTWMLTAANANKWENESPLTNDPRTALAGLASAVVDEATAHELASNEETRKSLELEFAELDARERCRISKQLILDAIGKFKAAALLNKCTDIIKTTPVSHKSKELAQQAVTQALSDALNREFQRFSLSHIKTSLKSRAVQGKTLHKLVLDVPTACKLPEILSEGELRVMAIASFLAELSLAAHSGGAIFDDPVSSLDHFRRTTVAQRLAEEATKRQVIVFTHDTVFLTELRSIIEREGRSAQLYHLEWTTADFSGYCNNGLPWHHQGIKDRFDSLEKEQSQLRKDWTPNPNAQLCDRMMTAYSHFRATIERCVETVFLNGVVHRFDNYIPVSKIDGVVTLDPSEIAELNRLFKIACDATNAHDPARGANRPPPDPAAFKTHINELKALLDAYKARKAAIP